MAFQNNQDINWWGINWWNNGKMLIQLGGGEENLREWDGLIQMRRN